MKPYYEHGGISIFCGDSRDLVPIATHGNVYDLMLTDPAYGINADRDRKSQNHGWVDYGSTGWDKEKTSNDLLNFVMQYSKKQVIWGGNYFELPSRMGWLVWDKCQREFSLADGELAWTSEQRALRIFSYSRALALQDGRTHPTQKPIALMKWCLSLFPEAKKVFDPFMGSGTTLVACKDMGIRCFGIDREERYCEMAAKRLQQEVFQFS